MSHNILLGFKIYNTEKYTMQKNGIKIWELTVSVGQHQYVDAISWHYNRSNKLL